MSPHRWGGCQAVCVHPRCHPSLRPPDAPGTSATSWLEMSRAAASTPWEPVGLVNGCAHPLLFLHASQMPLCCVLSTAFGVQSKSGTTSESLNAVSLEKGRHVGDPMSLMRNPRRTFSERCLAAKGTWVWLVRGSLGCWREGHDHLVASLPAQRRRSEVRQAKEGAGHPTD